MGARDRGFKEPWCAGTGLIHSSQTKGRDGLMILSSKRQPFGHWIPVVEYCRQHIHTPPGKSNDDLMMALRFFTFEGSALGTAHGCKCRLIEDPLQTVVALLGPFKPTGFARGAPRTLLLPMCRMNSHSRGAFDTSAPASSCCAIRDENVTKCRQSPYIRERPANLHVGKRARCKQRNQVLSEAQRDTRDSHRSVKPDLWVFEMALEITE
ncbi:hypothetical protein QFZ98_005146 [Paraburkholderia youngii]